MKNEARLELKLSKELLDALKTEAKKKQITVSALVRLVMLDYIKGQTNESKTDLTKL